MSKVSPRVNISKSTHDRHKREITRLRAQLHGEIDSNQNLEKAYQAEIKGLKEDRESLRADLAAVTAERDMMRNVVAQMSKKIYLHSDAAENVLRNVAASLCELDGYNPDDLASSDNGKSIWPNWHLYIDRARAAIEGVTEPASPWRDIESAPKDGTPILCVKKGAGFQPEILHFEDGVFGWLTDDMGFIFHPNRQPTHWMPLQEPPR